MPYYLTASALDHTGTLVDATCYEVMGDQYARPYDTIEAAEAARRDAAQACRDLAKVEPAHYAWMRDVQITIVVA